MTLAQELARKAIATLLTADAEVTAESTIVDAINSALDSAAEECLSHECPTMQEQAMAQRILALKKDKGAVESGVALFS